MADQQAHQQHRGDGQAAADHSDGLDRFPDFGRLVVGARRNDEIAEVLAVDSDGDLHAGRWLGEIAQPFGRVTFGWGLDVTLGFPVAGPIDANVAQILETIEEHCEAGARIRCPLQALDGGFDELPGQPHDAVILRMDAGPRTDDHHEHE